MGFRAIEARLAADSRALALMLMPNAQVDPIYVATIEPVVMLARALWETWFPLNVLHDSIEWSLGAARTWAQVRGPLAVALLSMRRVGWDVASLTCWSTRVGVLCNPCEVGPWVVRKLFTRDIEAWQWERDATSSERLALGHVRRGAVVQPLRRLLGVEASSQHAEQLTGKQKAYLRSALVNGQWPMHRLRNHGYVA